MKAFSVVFGPKGSIHVLNARAFLGPLRAAVLDEELARIRERLSALPESGVPVATRRGWSRTVRRVVLSESPYLLYYRLDLKAELVVVFAVRHQSRRPLRL